VDINKIDYKLPNTSFHKIKSEKDKIVIGNTYDVGMNHYDVWLKKINSKYKKTANYTIKLDGTIYEHFDPEYYSEFLDDKNINPTIISIILENEGWLTKDFTRNKYVNWCGEIYNRFDEVFYRKWRNKLYWAPYSINQINSLINLTNYLITKFDIIKYVSPDNIKLDDFDKKKGIYYRSNYSKNMLDVSPAFNFDYLKEQIEI